MLSKLKKIKVVLINDYSLSSLDTFKNERLKELNKAKYNDHEDIVCRYQLT